MLIAHNTDKKIGICDIETMFELFDVGFYNPDTKEWKEFQISAFKNELFEFVKFYCSGEYDYLVTFNGINFDQQVMEWIVDEHQKWVDDTNLQITEHIHKYAQNVIENSNYGIFPDYKENKFRLAPIDIFKILHFDNDARRTSLKWCAFMLNMDVEEMPIHHSARNLSEKDIETIQTYRRNDVQVTEGVFNLILGNVDLPELKDYKGKNKIQDRFDVMKETGMQCLNWSDVKIGEEWNKLNYIKEENVYDEKTIFPTKVVYPYGKKFKQFFPKSMKFTTPKLKNFIKEMGNTFVLAEKQEFSITIGSTTYTIAKGGLHSNEKNRRLKALEGYILRDADVGGQYPNFIIKEPVCPPHLKLTIIRIADRNVKNRSVYKAQAKKLTAEGKTDEARPLMGLQEMLKLCNNGGLFGKLGQKGSFLEYPEGLLRVCMGNEIEILMLIEMMEEAGFQVVSGNTDGIVTLFPADKEDLYKEVCQRWEETVGNVENGKLEYVDFDSLWQDSINSYIGKKKDGGVKKKGRFMTEFEINKNKSARIIPLALQQYFIMGKDPETFIRSHTNIFDFCIAKKATGKMHYEEVWNVPLDMSKVKGKVYAECDMIKVHKKLVRFFLSTKGSVLWKRGYNNMGKPMNNHVNAPNALGQPLVTYFNKFFSSDNYDIDYNQYILETLERIDNLEKTKKAKAFLDSLSPTQQLSLF